MRYIHDAIELSLVCRPLQLQCISVEQHLHRALVQLALSGEPLTTTAKIL